MTGDQYLYAEYADAYVADPDTYGLSTECIKKECSPIPLDGLTCFDSEGNKISATGKLPENSRCGRVCPAGQSHDFTTSDEFVKGNEKRKKRSHTVGGQYNFVPSEDAICTCGHQYSWPRETHDYYGSFYPDSYYGSYCEWTYGSGPMENYEPVVRERRDSKERLASQYGKGKQAAAYLGSFYEIFYLTSSLSEFKI